MANDVRGVDAEWLSSLQYLSELALVPIHVLDCYEYMVLYVVFIDCSVE
jgi:hypothetical protein